MADVSLFFHIILLARFRLGKNWALFANTIIRNRYISVRADQNPVSIRDRTRDVQIFIVSGDKTFRLALLMLLESEPGMVVNGMSDRLEGLLINLQSAQPEVLLLDYELIRQETAVFITKLHHLECRPKIVVLALDPQTENTVLAAGADGFICKNMPPDELLPILRGMRHKIETYST
jgi:response regulator RpfG family c-di-GMP phosphodiesterase